MRRRVGRSFPRKARCPLITPMQPPRLPSRCDSITQPASFMVFDGSRAQNRRIRYGRVFNSSGFPVESGLDTGMVTGRVEL